MRDRASQQDKDNSWAADTRYAQVPMKSANGFQSEGYDCHSL